MKKFIALLFVVALLCSTTVGCGGKDTKTTGGSTSTEKKADATTPKT